MRRRIAVLLLWYVCLPNAAPAIHAQHSSALSVRRCPPVTHNRRWNEEEFDSAGPGSVSRAGDPIEAPQLDPSFKIESLRGDYDILVIATAGVRVPDTISHGRLSLRSTDSTFHASNCFGRCDHQHYPLFGWTESSFHFPGGESARMPLSSRSEDDPGVTIRYSPSDRRLELLMGNSYGRSTDAGVILEVFRADSISLTGRWVDGGIGVTADQPKPYAHAQGYFCAWRIGSLPTVPNGRAELRVA
jgi:hypothetical protein